MEAGARRNTSLPNVGGLASAQAARPKGRRPAAFIFLSAVGRKPMNVLFAPLAL